MLQTQMTYKQILDVTRFERTIHVVTKTDLEIIKRQRKLKGQSRMENPEKLAILGTRMDNPERLATLGTLNTRRQTKQKQKTQYAGHHYTETNTNNIIKT